jgi:phospholipid/cholesterol/gamma-HCH transport system substrate-binding protein
MARRQYDLLVGLFALGALIVLAYMIVQFGGGVHKYRDTIEVVVEFNQVAGLIKDAPVYLSGVEIGRVTDIRVTEAGKVHVSVKVARQAGLRAGDQPEILQTGVLGDVVVNFLRGEKPGELASSGTRFVGRDPVNIMAEAEKAVASIRSILEILSSEETTSTLKGIMENIQALTGEENRELLRTSLENLSALTTEMRHDMETLRTVFTPEFSEDVRSIVANAQAASENLPELMSEGTLILRETRQNLIEIADSLNRNAARFDSIMASLDDILATIARGEGTIGLAIKDPEMYESTVGALASIKQALNDIKYNLPLGVGRRIKEAEEAEQAELAREQEIWKR